MAESLGYALNDLAGYITEISPSYAAALGYRCVDLIGHHFSEVVAPEFCAGTVRCFRDVVEQGLATEFRAVYALPDRSRLAMQVSMMPVRDDAGRVRSVLIVPHPTSLAPQFRANEAHLMGECVPGRGAAKP